MFSGFCRDDAASNNPVVLLQYAGLYGKRRNSPFAGEESVRVQGNDTGNDGCTLIMCGDFDERFVERF